MIIEAKTLGSRQRPFEPWEIDLFEKRSETLTLQDFLTRIVLHELEAFKLRQESRKLARALSREEIAEGAARGKVDMGGRDLQQEVNPAKAVENALLAFKDGFYFVFVDEIQIETLSDSITLNPESQILFLRLVPLVGG